MSNVSKTLTPQTTFTPIVSLVSSVYQETPTLVREKDGRLTSVYMHRKVGLPRFRNPEDLDVHQGQNHR